VLTYPTREGRGPKRVPLIWLTGFNGVLRVPSLFREVIWLGKLGIVGPTNQRLGCILGFPLLKRGD